MPVIREPLTYAVFPCAMSLAIAVASDVSTNECQLFPWSGTDILGTFEKSAPAINTFWAMKHLRYDMLNTFVVLSCETVAEVREPETPKMLTPLLILLATRLASPSIVCAPVK